MDLGLVGKTALVTGAVDVIVVDSVAALAGVALDNQVLSRIVASLSRRSATSW